MKHDVARLKTKRAVSACVFLVLFALLFSFVNDLLLDKEPSYYRYRNYMALPQNSVDILYIGNSHFNAAIDAQLVDELVGDVFGFNCSVSGMRIDYGYYRFQNALRTQSPRLVVLDTFCLVPLDEKENETSTICWSLDGIPMSADKAEAINDLVPFSERANFYVPFLKYHSRWQDVTLEEVASLFDQSAYADLGRRAQNTDNAMEAEDNHFEQDLSKVKGSSPLTEKHQEYLEKFLNLAKEKGAKVLLLSVPYRQQFGQSSVEGAKVNNFLREQYVDGEQVQLLDVNEYYTKLRFSYGDMQDDGHVNASGSDKTCRFLAQYIEDSYEDLFA